MPVTEGRAVAKQQHAGDQPDGATAGPADGIETAIAAGEMDTSIAHPARVYDYWLGGTSNYPADREAAERVLAATPGLRWRVRANRAFLVRAVRYLAGEAGIRQFLDVGTGIPAADNTHEVAQAVAPDARVVYADNDPIVLAHAQALLASDPRGATRYVHGDARDPAAILTAAGRTLDLARPTALMLIGMLHLIQDGEDPHRIVTELMAALAPGSYLAISHPASDIHPGQAQAQRRYNERVATPQTLRSRTEVARFFEGLDLVAPGLVYVHEWRPGPADAAPEGAASAYGGVARKP
jgi:SAM-dependent methyltransferase